MGRRSSWARLRNHCRRKSTRASQHSVLHSVSLLWHPTPALQDQHIQESRSARTCDSVRRRCHHAGKRQPCCSNLAGMERISLASATPEAHLVQLVPARRTWQSSQQDSEDAVRKMPFVLDASHLLSAPRTPSAVRSMPKASTKRASISFGVPTQESAYSKNTPNTNTTAKTSV